MSDVTTLPRAPALPRAAGPFVAFASLLRRNGFPAAADQTAAFLAAVELLGPRSMADIRRAAFATFAPPPGRHADFLALFAAHFLGETMVALEPATAEDDEVKVQEEGRGLVDPVVSEKPNESGREATAAEALSLRRFGGESDSEALRRFARAAPARLPRRRGYRRRALRSGPDIDFRRTLKEAVKNDGEAMRLARHERRPRIRKVLLLIDVSGSMKERTEPHLQFAHVLARAAPQIEVFTFGTRLTRITRAMRLKNRAQAMEAASQVVSDWDGGTRIGDALAAFLAVPRFASYARSAVTLIVSDGLERGDSATMQKAVARLAALSWRVDWISPLAIGRDFRPETAALKAILPLIDDLADGSALERICAHVLALGRRRAA